MACPQEAWLSDPQSWPARLPDCGGQCAQLHLVKGGCVHIPGPPRHYPGLGLWLGPCPHSESEYISGTAWQEEPGACGRLGGTPEVISPAPCS